jgi:hypothetical protein
MKVAPLVIAMAIMTLVAGCVGQQPSETALVNIYAAGGQVAVSAEVADTDAERSLGLMNRQDLGESQGMLFVFDNEAIRSFWMRNTLIPLDIMFIDSQRRIVDIQTMQPCAGDPCRLYRSAGPAKYALEVNAGFAEARGIKVGDRISLNG